jgi:phage terminase Nu1 subunit (DNA packaging protein)
VTVQTLVNWDKQENPPPRNSDNSYPARAYGEWLATHRGQKKRGPKAQERPEGDDSFVEAERRLKLAQAIKAERQNEIDAGKLLDVGVIETTWQRILMRVKSRLLKIPTTVAPIVLGDTDAHSIQLKLKDAVHDALSELVDDWRDGEETDDE